MNPHGVQNIIFLSTIISHFSSTNMSLCFIITMYTFFFIYPQKMKVKCDNMLRRYIVTCEQGQTAGRSGEVQNGRPSSGRRPGRFIIKEKVSD